jgi:hypothetical protein
VDNFIIGRARKTDRQAIYAAALWAVSTPAVGSTLKAEFSDKRIVNTR